MKKNFYTVCAAVFVSGIGINLMGTFVSWKFGGGRKSFGEKESVLISGYQESGGQGEAWESSGNIFEQVAGG